MELIAVLGRTLGFSLAAGINLYASVAILGLASRFGWVELPESFQLFDNPVVIGVALVLYAVEFAADKIPWVDTAWPTPSCRQAYRDLNKRYVGSFAMFIESTR